MRTFFPDRYHLRAPLWIVLCRDMLVVGTIINLAFLGLAVMVLEMGAPDWIALVVFLLPMPYNIFLWLTVWRQTSRMPRGATLPTVVATFWLIAMFVI